MEVRPGYRQTEVGLIPQDWEVRRFSEHFRIYAGGDVPRHSLAQTRSATHPHPIFANTLQNRGLYGYTAERRSPAGSVTITARGYLGHAEYRDQPFFPVVRLLVMEPTGKLDPRFTACAVNDRVRFCSESTGVPQLTAPQVGKCCIAAPASVEEQRAIAGALGDVDELLGGLERLIAKKRDLKQAAMQQLLSGQARLPGFCGEWGATQLGRVASIKTGSRNNGDKTEDGRYPFFVRSEVVERIDSYSHDCEAILVPGEGRIGSIFHYIHGRFDVHQRVYAITQFRPGISARFVYFYMSKNFGAWAMQNTVKATVDSLRLPAFQTFEVVIPPTFAEQVAIAEALAEMDLELSALEQRAEKTRSLKRAMMQELLTGRGRLVSARRPRTRDTRP